MTPPDQTAPGRLLDGAVCALYGLSAEEIAVVERAAGVIIGMIEKIEKRGVRTMAELHTDLYGEIVEFISGHPSLEDIAAFRISEANDSRVSELLAANRTRRLTDDEAAELDEFGRIEHVLTMIKLTASLKLKKQAEQEGSRPIAGSLYEVWSPQDAGGAINALHQALAKHRQAKRDSEMDSAALTQILAREVAAYAREMLNGQLYLTTNPEKGVFAVISIGEEQTEYSADASLIARIIDNKVIIDHDMNDKPLVDALVQAGVPRKQIIVAYAGEPIPAAI